MLRAIAQEHKTSPVHLAGLICRNRSLFFERKRNAYR